MSRGYSNKLYIMNLIYTVDLGLLYVIYKSDLYFNRRVFGIDKKIISMSALTRHVFYRLGYRQLCCIDKIHIISMLTILSYYTLYVNRFICAMNYYFINYTLHKLFITFYTIRKVNS